jgi:tRNA1(Val) A37 N6-methylase TrmN6
LSATTLDQLLDGAISLHQPADGYRAGLDAVLLAAALDARSGERLMEFGCGAGAVLMCAASRLADCRLTGVEVDPATAQMARNNIALNQMQDRIDVISGDIVDAEPGEIVEQVFFNPPFFDDPRHIRLPRPEKQRAWLSGDRPLAAWVRRAAQILNGKGRLTLIHRADALDEIIACLAPAFGSIVIKPIQPRADRAATRVLVTARIGGRSPLVLLSPLVLHDDGTNLHTPEVDAVMRGKAAISLAGPPGKKPA